MTLDCCLEQEPLQRPLQQRPGNCWHSVIILSAFLGRSAPFALRPIVRWGFLFA